MSSSLVRWGGLAGVATGVMYALTAILSLRAPQQSVFDSFNDYLIELIFVVAGREALDAVFPIGVLAILVGSVLLGAATRTATAMVVWSTADRRLPPLRCLRRGR